MTQPLARSSLSAQIRERLLAQIMRGDLKPGERLIELKIAAEMETSQAPVREALRELEALGVVETLHNRGARVRVVSNEELVDIYEVRAQLEGFAAERAAGSVTTLKPRLEAEMANMRAAAERADTASFSDHNTAFHRIILEAARNQTLTELWDRLNVRARTILNISRQQTDLVAVSESHRTLIDAIESGDGPHARDAAIAHVMDNKPKI